MSSSSAQTPPQRLNEIIRQRRRALGLTQKELARQTHLSKSALQKIELGALRPSALVVQALARALQFDETITAQLVRASQQNAQGLARQARAWATPPAFYFGRIPFHTKPLSGRDAALRQIGAILTRPQTRLVTLIGPPGVGKTHLAIASAARLIGISQPTKRNEPPTIAFPDGAFLVELAETHSAEQILPAVGRTIGLKPDQCGDLQVLYATLRTSRCLLIFDNFEHVLDGSRHLSALLANTSAVRILVTSQAALNMPAEHLFRVEQLPLPSAGELLLSWHDLHKYPSLDMFEQVARRHTPSFALNSLSAAELDAIVTLCNRVDGLPLAIELVASEWRSDKPGQVLEQMNRIDSVLALTSQRMRDLPDKQQSLLATFAWSQSLLSPPAKQAFQQLSICIGSFSMETAQAFDVSADALHELTRRNLLRSFDVDDSLSAESSTHVETRRWSMLPVIREFANGMLAQAGEAEALPIRLAQHFAALLRKHKPHLRALRSQSSVIYAHAKLDRPDIVALIEWGCTAPNRLLAVFELLVEYTWLVYVFGDINSSYALLLRAIQRCRAWLRVDDAPFIERGYSELLKSLTWCMLMNHASLLQWIPETNEVMASAVTDLTHKHNADEELQRRYALWMWLDIDQRHEQAALEAARIEAIPAETLGTPAQIVLHSFYNNRANSERTHGNYRNAIALAHKALNVPAARPAEQCIVWQNIARAQHALGNLDEARASYASALQALNGTQDRYALMYLFDGAACLAGSMAAYREAVTFFGAADAIREEMLVDIPHVNRVNYEAALVSTRAALGVNLFNRQIKLARKMPISDVIGHLQTFLSRPSAASMGH